MTSSRCKVLVYKSNDKMCIRDRYRLAEALYIRFVDASWRSGDSDMSCLIASGMAEVMNGIYLELNGLCRDKLKQITVGEVEKQLFSRKRKGEAK